MICTQNSLALKSHLHSQLIAFKVDLHSKINLHSCTNWVQNRVHKIFNLLILCFIHLQSCFIRRNPKGSGCTKWWFSLRFRSQIPSRHSRFTGKSWTQRCFNIHWRKSPSAIMATFGGIRAGKPRFDHGGIRLCSVQGLPRDFVYQNSRENPEWSGQKSWSCRVV